MCCALGGGWLTQHGILTPKRKPGTVGGKWTGLCESSARAACVRMVEFHRRSGYLSCARRL